MWKGFTLDYKTEKDVLIVLFMSVLYSGNMTQFLEFSAGESAMCFSREVNGTGKRKYCRRMPQCKQNKKQAS